jgi:hypothetical protein
MTDRFKLVRAWFRECLDFWNWFWFTPRAPHTLSLMRILTGMMLVYTHAVWSLELDSMMGLHGIFDLRYSNEFNGNSPFTWTHFTWFDSPAWLWGSHFVTLAVMLAFTIGWATRTTGILSALLVVSYAHRASGALFGLDQINCILVLYLAIGPTGNVYSVDAWRRNQSGQGGHPNDDRSGISTMATVSTRLIQLHLCVVYLFAGLGKLQGSTWWDGTAIWGALASYEYQTVDLTFLANWPWLVNLITLVALAWECSYAFLIWPRLTRPVWLILAVAVHLGIGVCMGMMTFGIIMIIANLAFIEPSMIRMLLERLSGRIKVA